MMDRRHTAEGNERENKKEIEYYFWIHAAFRKYVEVILDLILMGLVIVTFVLIGKTIYLLGISLYETTNISFVISEIMFIFILIETVRLLVIYLEFHRVAIDTMVEIAIVSILREMILKGVLHVEPIVLASVSFFLIVLGLLLRFGGLRLEKEMFSIYRPFITRPYKNAETRRQK
jgi:uncharacterized membrane protein (DUF373 family)